MRASPVTVLYLFNMSTGETLVLKIRNVRAELFVRYQAMAVDISRKIATRFNRPYAEMEEEALSQLAWVCARWTNPENGSRYNGKKDAAPQTWIYQCVYWHLWIYAEKEGKRRQVALQEADGKEVQCGWAEGVLGEVGEEAQALLRVLFEAPGEVAGALWRTEEQRNVVLNGVSVPVEVRAPKQRLTKVAGRGREAVSSYLQGRGWEDGQIERAWHEVACAVGGVA